MEAIADFYAQHPFWTWIAVAAVLLAVEVALGTEFLLWAAVSAGLVALLGAVVDLNLAVELALFAALTVAAWLISWKFYPKRRSEDADINDPAARLVGREGHAVGPFVRGEGRVFVDGKEWGARSEEDLAGGDRITVLAVQDGASLSVRRLPL